MTTTTCPQLHDYYHMTSITWHTWNYMTIIWPPFQCVTFIHNPPAVYTKDLFWPYNLFFIDTVCTDISSTAKAPLAAFFGYPVSIDVPLYGEPPPRASGLMVHLEHSDQSLVLTSEMTQRELVKLSDDTPLLLWAYIVQVMDIDMNVTRAKLTFSVTYETVNSDSCESTQGQTHITYTIPVFRSECALCGNYCLLCQTKGPWDSVQK